MKEFCENPLCENQSVKEVPVSVDKPSDQVRSLCATCEEAYMWGVQHGGIIAQQEALWVVAVADKGIVAHARAYKSEDEAEMGLLEHLRKYQGYNGRDDIEAAYEWLSEHDERLSVEIVKSNLE